MDDLFDFLTAGEGVELQAIVAMLASLASASSDAGLAYARARLRRRWAAQTDQRPAWVRPGWMPAVGGGVGEDGYVAAVESARRGAVVYASAAARLAGVAVPVAGRLAAGQRPDGAASHPIVPSDILTMSRRYVP